MNSQMAESLAKKSQPARELRLNALQIKSKWTGEKGSKTI